MAKTSPPSPPTPPVEAPETVQTVQDELPTTRTKTTGHPRIDLYESEAGTWRWVLWSHKGKALCGSIGDYSRQNDAFRAAQHAVEQMPHAHIAIRK
jgi:hypothetical protein